MRTPRSLLLLSLFFGCGSPEPAPEAADPLAEFDRSVAAFSRVEIAHLPTPLEEMPALAAELGGPRLFVKREDLTGLAFGGNKARKLEFILADAVDKGSDSVLTWAGVQSNWARMTAAGARRLGMQPILVLQQGEHQWGEHQSVSPADGNLLLDRLLDADVRILEPDGDREAAVEQIAAEEIAAGRTPYVVAVGGSRTGHSMDRPLGAVAYAEAFRELMAQAQEMGIRPTHIVHASGSGSTQAGFVVGARALASEVRVIGISTGSAKEASEANVLAIARETVETMGLEVEIRPEDVLVRDDYVGEGYGILNEDIVRAISQVARTEGLLLDPVYTGKAMAGLLDLIARGELGPEDTVVFIHTGGTPALFPYREELLETDSDSR